METMDDKKKRRLPKSCIFCRRSHVVCDEKRPCSRCIKRNIAHICVTSEPELLSTQQNVANSSMTTTVVPPQESGTNIIDNSNLQSPNVGNLNSNMNNDNITNKVNSNSTFGFSGNLNFNTNTNSSNIQTSSNNTNVSNLNDSMNEFPPSANDGVNTFTTNNSKNNENVSPGINNNTSVPNNVELANYILPQTFISPNVGSEFNSLNEFLSILENPLSLPNEGSNGLPDLSGNYQNSTNNNVTNTINNTTNPAVLPVSGGNNNLNTSIKNSLLTAGDAAISNITTAKTATNATNNTSNMNNSTSNNMNNNAFGTANTENVSAKEQFFMTAADPSVEMTPEERLKLVINAKLEAGLLKPYNYADGYTRLQNYMELNMSNVSRQRILKPLSMIRPAFRTIAKSLKDIDLILVEENFERMLLSYDRVFTSMSMPACIWRRTGEIYRANKEFASLVNCPVNLLRDGKLAIYELMNEDSTVNYWEKYGSIAFDQGQKTVLTSCTLLDKINGNERQCCFSFTIRRDRYNIPICIVGNFIPIS